MIDSFSKSLPGSEGNLTRKELLVADLIELGKNTAEIGILRKTSRRTAETYRI